MSTESPEAHGSDSQRPIKRLRFAPRTNLACTACRRRKTRCSGEFPTCSACNSRNEECIFEGIRAQVTVRASEDAREIARETTTEPVRAANPSAPPANQRTLPVQNGYLPNPELRRKAVAYFRENYESTLLCFIPPQDLILDDTGENLPFVLLLSILTLTTKFISDFTPAGHDPSKAANHFAELTRRELELSYNKPSLVTIQVCLILSIHEYGHGADHDGWLCLGHAIRLAQLMQLHKLDSDPAPSEFVFSSKPPDSLTTLESKRRTLWCAFNMERLLANGKDRIAVLKIEHITTRLPQLDEDFIYGRENDNRTLKDDLFGNPKHREGLYTHLIRILNILGNVMTWHGNGGRFTDSTCPWLPDMPFGFLDRSLDQWRLSLPKHLDHTPSNLPLILAAGHGKIWIPMFCIFYQAKAMLHREYIPFTSIEGYDPSLGPCDGPSLTPANCTPPQNWYRNSAQTMISSANAISSLQRTSRAKHLSGTTSYPFNGLSTLVAASIHIQCTVYNWPSMQHTTGNSLDFLKDDLEACNLLAVEWPIGRHWIQQISLYHKLNLLTQRSFENPTTGLTSNIHVSDVKNGIMNYIRYTNPQFVFDFDTWIGIVNNAPVEREGVHASKSGSDMTHPPMKGGPWWKGWDVERDGELSIFR